MILAIPSFKCTMRLQIPILHKMLREQKYWKTTIMTTHITTLLITMMTHVPIKTMVTMTMMITLTMKMARTIAVTMMTAVTAIAAITMKIMSAATNVGQIKLMSKK